MGTLSPRETFYKYYSQYGQDEFIHKNLLSNNDSNIFIDVGAYDGIIGSNTKFFEDNGWDGVCFEPNPKVYEKLIKNRKSQCVLGAAWDTDENQIFRVVEGYAEMLSGMVDELNDPHRARIDKECSDMGGSYSDILVNCYDLGKFLISNDIFNVTYISLDTEGSEYRILKSLDLNKIYVKIFSIENNYQDYNVDNYLTSQGYKKVTTLKIDDIYVKI